MVGTCFYFFNSKVISVLKCITDLQCNVSVCVIWFTSFFPLQITKYSVGMLGEKGQLGFEPLKKIRFPGFLRIARLNYIRHTLQFLGLRDIPKTKQVRILATVLQIFPYKAIMMYFEWLQFSRSYKPVLYVTIWAIYLSMQNDILDVHCVRARSRHSSPGYPDLIRTINATREFPGTDLQSPYFLKSLCNWRSVSSFFISVIWIEKVIYRSTISLN